MEATVLRFAPGVLVVERHQRRLEAALKRQLAAEVFVRPCKTLADVREHLAARPGSVVVLDLASSDQGPVLAHCVESRRAAGVLGIVGMLSPEDECALREAGVTSLFFDPVNDEVIAAQCRRLLAPTAAVGPGLAGIRLRDG